MKLVHDDLAEVRLLALTQGNVGKNLCSTADNRRLRINGGVAGNHAHVLGTKNIDEVEELLGYQRLNGGSVIGTLTGRQARKMRGNSHSGLTRTGRGCQHHVMSGGNAQNGLVLGGVEGHAAGRNPLGEGLVNLFGGEGIALEIASIIITGVLAQRGRKKIQNTHRNSSVSGMKWPSAALRQSNYALDGLDIGVVSNLLSLKQPANVRTRIPYLKIFSYICSKIPRMWPVFDRLDVTNSTVTTGAPVTNAM